MPNMNHLHPIVAHKAPISLSSPLSLNPTSSSETHPLPQLPLKAESRENLVPTQKHLKLVGYSLSSKTVPQAKALSQL